MFEAPGSAEEAVDIKKELAEGKQALKELEKAQEALAEKAKEDPSIAAIAEQLKPDAIDNIRVALEIAEKKYPQA